MIYFLIIYTIVTATVFWILGFRSGTDLYKKDLGDDTDDNQDY